MKLTISEMAGMIGARVSGDPDFVIEGVAGFHEAGPREVTFASDAEYLNRLDQTRAGAVIVPEGFESGSAPAEIQAILKTASPKLSFFKIVALFHPGKKNIPFINPGACIGRSTIIGKDPVIEAHVFVGNRVTIGDHVHLMPGVYVGDEVEIGSHTVIKPNVTILDRTRIGERVLIHSGTVIGCDGFGFAQDADQHQKLAHTGYVAIGNDVEIGACNTIDRGTLGMTVIGNGVKTDNQVHIAHNVRIGDHTLIVAQSAIAGSTRVGRHVIIAGKAGISGHITIGDGAVIGPYSGVHSHVKSKEVVSGIPQMPHNRWRKVVSILSRLPEIRKMILTLDKRLSSIENQIKQSEPK